MPRLFYSLGINEFSVAEQQELLQDLQDMEFGRQLEANPELMPEWMAKLFDEREAEALANPGGAITLEEFKRQRGLS